MNQRSIYRQKVVFVVEGDRDLGRIHGPTRRRPVEDYIRHLLAAETFYALLAQNPLDRVDNVRLPRPVGTDHDRDPGGELEQRLVGETLETDNFQGLEHGLMNVLANWVYSDAVILAKNDPVGCLISAETEPFSGTFFGSFDRLSDSAVADTPLCWVA